MKFKREKGWDGENKVPKHQVTRIRKEVKAEKAKQLKKERRKRSKESRT